MPEVRPRERPPSLLRSPAILRGSPPAVQPKNALTLLVAENEEDTASRSSRGSDRLATRSCAPVTALRRPARRPRARDFQGGRDRDSRDELKPAEGFGADGAILKLFPPTSSRRPSSGP